jgi:hypothetical protein
MYISFIKYINHVLGLGIGDLEALKFYFMHSGVQEQKNKINYLIKNANSSADFG